ncbi:MAG TPA: helix-hairpin-helix domain-containing protein [Candidatus Binataceae bacterium]
MDNHEIARVLHDIADMLEISGDENFFRIRAYRYAGHAVDDLTQPLAGLDEEQVRGTLGIGADLAGKIVELIGTGEMALYVELRERVPPGLLELRQVSGLGPKRIRQLAQIARITNRDDLARAVESGALRTIRGFGPKTEQRILRSLERLRERG